MQHKCCIETIYFMWAIKLRMSIYLRLAAFLATPGYLKDI